MSLNLSDSSEKENDAFSLQEVLESDREYKDKANAVLGGSDDL